MKKDILILVLAFVEIFCACIGVVLIYLPISPMTKLVSASVFLLATIAFLMYIVIVTKRAKV